MGGNKINLVNDPLQAWAELYSNLISHEKSRKARKTVGQGSDGRGGGVLGLVWWWCGAGWDIPGDMGI